MTIPEKAVRFMLDTANDDSHGYDQSSRWGPDYDCSSLVITAYKEAGVPLTATYTGNMWRDFLDHGFEVASDVDLATGAGLRPGDVLLNTVHHTAMYVGNGRICHASGNEHGGATGGQTGDQTGKEISVTGYFNFPWDVVLRYSVAPEPSPAPDATGTYVVRSGDTLWGIAEKLYGNPWRYHDIEAANNIKNAMIYPGQVLLIPGLTPDTKVSVTMTVMHDTYQLLTIMADGNHLTIGEVVDKLLEDAR